MNLVTKYYTLYYFKFKMHLSSNFSKIKIRVCLKFQVLFFTPLESQKYQFLQRTSGLAEIVLQTVKCICLQKLSMCTKKFLNA